MRPVVRSTRASLFRKRLGIIPSNRRKMVKACEDASRLAIRPGTRLSLCMHDAILEFLQAPNRARYRAVRKQLFAHPKFSRASLQIAKLGTSLAEGSYASVLRATSTLLPQCGLSPRVHRFWSIAAAEMATQAHAQRRLKDDHRKEARLNDTAEIHRFGYEACLMGLAATGDGSPAKPYLPTYVSDELELLEFLDVGTLISQRVVQRGRQSFDILETDRGELWFDITELLPHVPVLRRKPMAANR